MAVASHFPHLTHRYSLTECVGSACHSTVVAQRPPQRARFGIHLRIDTPAGFVPQDLDGQTITYTVTSQGRAWVGSGTLHYVDEPEPCGCDGLRATVTVSPRG